MNSTIRPVDHNEMARAQQNTVRSTLGSASKEAEKTNKHGINKLVTL